MRELGAALRSLLRRPGFTVTVIVTLAVAVGVNTLMFSVVNAVLLRPLPYAEPDRLVRVVTQYHSLNETRGAFSTPELNELARDNRCFESLSVWGTGTATFGDLDRPMRVPAAYTTADFLTTLGVAPAMGRYFSADEDLPGDPRVVVLSDRLWQRAFAGDPAVIGRSVEVDGHRVTIVGVMPRGFDFPRPDVEAWIPLGLDRRELARDRGSHSWEAVARLRPGVSLAAARAELAGLVRRGEGLGSPLWHALSSDEHPVAVFGLKDEIIGEARTPLWLLQAAVLFILLIACANLGNLFLVRAEARARELAVRTALGAGRWQLVRLFLVESLLCGAVGGALGVVVAIWGVDAVAALLPAGAPRAAEIAIDAGVLGFGLLCTASAAVIAGLAPVFHTRVGSLHTRLAEGGRTHTGRSRLQRLLVAAEVAAAVVLALGCGLMVKSLHRLTQVDLGFRPGGLLSFELELLQTRHPRATRLAFWDRLDRELEAIPGVSAVSLSSSLPTQTTPPQNVIWFPGAPHHSAKGAPVAEWHVVGDGYFETVGARLLRGRLPTPADKLVLVLNQSAARRFFPDVDPVGQVMRVAPWRPQSPPQTVVGVIADIKQHGAASAAGDGVYIMLRDSVDATGNVPATMRIQVRAAAPAALAGTVEAAVRRLDPSLPLSFVRTLDQVLWEAVARPRFVALVMLVFAGLALLLAATGVYGVISYSVEQRTRELAIRVALGARPAAVGRLVLGQTLRLAGQGIAAGLVAALVLSVVLSSLFAEVLFETRALDPLVLAAVAAVVMAIALAAAAVPARRAVRVDPMVSLRSE